MLRAAKEQIRRDPMSRISFADIASSTSKKLVELEQASEDLFQALFNNVVCSELCGLHFNGQVPTLAEYNDCTSSVFMLQSTRPPFLMTWSSWKPKKQLFLDLVHGFVTRNVPGARAVWRHSRFLGT